MFTKIMQWIKGKKDPVFGTLLYDKKTKCWDGKVEISPGKEIKVSLDPEKQELEKFLDRARKVFKTIQSKEPEIRKEVAKGNNRKKRESYLNLYNDNWRGDNPKISLQQFMNSITLLSMTLYSSGLFELFYDDGDLFGEHYIVVDVKEDGSVDHVHLYG